MTCRSFHDIRHLDLSLLGHRGEENLRGQKNITTDESGRALATISLGGMKEVPSLGSTLSINVQWVGPTRELIKESASVK